MLLVYCVLCDACILYIAHCMLHVLHAVHCVLCTACCMLYAAHCMLHTVWCMLCTVCCMLHTIVPTVCCKIWKYKFIGFIPYIYTIKYNYTITYTIMELIYGISRIAGVERQSTSLIVLCLVEPCLLKGGFSLKWQRFCFTLLGLSLAVLGCTFQFQPHTGSHVKKWWKMAREQARYSVCCFYFWKVMGFLIRKLLCNDWNSWR